VKRTERRGWGVFTHQNIKAGCIIEISPVIVMTHAEKELLDQTQLFNYLFDWNENNCCMAMGLIPIYNHASPSNCEYFQDYEDATMFIKTVRPIRAEEELTINYNGDWDSQKKVWFEVLD
jgi:SET domain-containing protein